MLSKALSCFLVTASMALCQPALAQEKPVKLESRVLLLRPAAAEVGAQPQLVEPKNVVPGDTLVFTTSFRNDGTNSVNDFVIVNPVPENLLLSDEAAAQSEVSIDGGQEWGRLANLTVPDNSGEERPAAAGDVTHLRWTFNQIPPGGTGKVKFSAKVR